MSVLIAVVHVIVCLALIMIVLLQTGKGADMGAVFGGAGSQTLFGSTGGATFLGKLTTGAAVIFMLTSLTLAYMSKSSDKSVVSDFRTTPSQSSESLPAPAGPVPDAKQVAPPAMDPNANMDISETPGSQPTAPPSGDAEMPVTRDHTGADQ
jgi:preprotein translocase subunit SecG